MFGSIRAADLCIPFPVHKPFLSCHVTLYYFFSSLLEKLNFGFKNRLIKGEQKRKKLGRGGYEMALPYPPLPTLFLCHSYPSIPW